MTKRIWHVSSNPWNSAVTEYALSACMAMQQSSWEVSFSCLKGTLPARRAAELGLSGPAFSNFGLRELRAFRRAFLEIRPDVVCLYGGKENFLSRFLPRDAKIIRLRGSDRDITHIKPPLSYRLSEGPLSAVLVPCEEAYKRYKLLSTHPVHLVPIGLSTERFFFSPRSFLKAKEERPTLRIIGRFDPVKGHREFFPVFKTILDRWSFDAPRPFLEIIGNPVNVTARMLTESAERAGLVLEEDVKIIPWRFKNLADIMSRTHLGIVSSLRSEVICRVAQEFLLCGTPIAVSGVGALKEVLVEPSFGVHYEDLSQAESADLIMQMLYHGWQESVNTRRDRAEEARRHFSYERMGQDLSKIFDAL